jgi:hypothetical protein
MPRRTRPAYIADTGAANESLDHATSLDGAARKERADPPFRSALLTQSLSKSSSPGGPRRTYRRRDSSA